MKNLFSVADKIIAITGGGGVLCGNMSRALAEAGAKVAVLDLNEDAAGQVVKDIEARKGCGLAVKCNVLDRASTEAALAKVTAELGAVDVLINGAGGNKKEATTSPDMSFFDMPADAIRAVFDLNCLGTILPSQVFGKYMADKGEGVILNISSMNAFRPLTKIAAYSAAKAAVSNFTQWLAVHMCQNYCKEIRVNAICPSFTDTPMVRAAGEKVMAMMAQEVGGILKAEDIAEGVLELVRDDSRAGAVMRVTVRNGLDYAFERR